MPNTVLVTPEPPIAVVQLNRPDVLNALNEEVLDELVTALRRLDDDPSVRCIVVTGNERAFAAGADIKENFVAATPVTMLAQDLTTRWEAIRRVKTPLIAAVSGFALGGGCELAMTCDIIVASETAKFGQPEINLGIIPGAGGTQRLTRAVGKWVANEMILTGRFVGAQEAKAIGLVAQVYPAVSWLQDAKTLARTIAEKAPVAARLATEAVDLAWNSTLDAGLEFERKAFYLLFATEDKNAWINGGSPTKGFLANAATGPFQDFYNNIAGAAWADWLFMIGLAGLGIALLLGIGMRIAAVAGGILYVMMWTVVLPPEINPFMDEHLIFAGVLAGLALVAAGNTLGLGKAWAKLPLVQRLPWLK